MVSLVEPPFNSFVLFSMVSAVGPPVLSEVERAHSILHELGYLPKLVRGHSEHRKAMRGSLFLNSTFSILNSKPCPERSRRISTKIENRKLEQSASPERSRGISNGNAPLGQ